ncbi:hypothetical protein [Fusobacterium mortiferum]|uniref:hypothetical protein n=1 Tax=Fusobacterium mortiferum TaxID=850 RepID=UPI000E43FEA3|nr:hypothetical protein [Fusobacterium mortiferum]RGN00747.1 hypothetical protein DXB84_02380 [Fusobacterium mortiferum]
MNDTIKINDIIKKLFGLEQKELALLLFFLSIFTFSIYALIVILIEEKKLLKHLKKYKIIEKHKQEILLILILPIIFLILVCFGLIELDSWLGFFGGYFGVLGTFGAVWWQLENDKKQEKLKEEKEEKIKIRLIKTLLDEMYSRIDMTYNTILLNLNPIAKILGNNYFYFLLDEERLKIYFNTIFLLENEELVEELAEIHYRVSRLEVFLKQYLVSVGSSYNGFKKSIENIEINHFKIESTLNDLKFTQYESYEKTLNLLNQFNDLCKKYQEEKKIEFSEEDYKINKTLIQDLISIFNICFEGDQKNNILLYLNSYYMLLDKMSQFLYGNYSLKNTELLIKETHDKLK